MASERNLTFPSDDRMLAGRLFGVRDAVVGRPQPGVLFIHGYGSDQRGNWPRAEAVAASSGAICLTFDLGGHRDSSGNLDHLFEKDHERDALVAYDELLAVGGIDPDRIGVCGASYGGYLAVLLASKRPVGRLLLRAPAPGQDGLRRAASILAAYPGRVFIVESERDEVISRATIAAYLEACGGRARHHTIPGAAHALTDPRWQQEYLDLVVEWFKEM